MDEEQLLHILFHSKKTETWLRSVKAKHPDKWQRIYGNIKKAYEVLKEHRIQKSFFNIGIYEQADDENWPWHNDYYNGLYLSDKKRPCKQQKAAEFDTPEQARQFFDSWRGKSKYKMEVIEFKKWITATYEEAMLNSTDWQVKPAQLKVVPTETE